jgi:hypothetical protein
MVGCAPVHYDNVYLSADGKPVAKKLTEEQQDSINKLRTALIALGNNTSVEEAESIAYDAVVYPLILANKWDLMSPPQYHNMLVNAGRRPRGLCYQWAEDLTALMRKKNLRTFDLHHGMAFRHTKDEHNSLIVSAKGDDLREGIVLDPWRFSGVLYWSKVVDDKKHPWIKFK